ncbi:hypothetical protein E2C01_023980 [Portunus trituberculatus]|uniref:Transmembrane protein n=1 Tax=Portunus trituberculatus TaxID=210409 RepID=A0A5B7E996_PORTR|nr:hypothetical protein [Portunus trituberculatus]
MLARLSLPRTRQHLELVTRRLLPIFSGHNMVTLLFPMSFFFLPPCFFFQVVDIGTSVVVASCCGVSERVCQD